MNNDQKDERFSNIWKDPQFRPVPKKERKIKIDKRFESMFTDDSFKMKYLDKRGRTVQSTSKENLKRFYEISSSSEDDSDADDKDVSDNKESLACVSDITSTVKSTVSNDVTSTINEVDTGSTTSEESDFENNENEFDHKWGELDNDALTIDEPTSRLAICNMDWDRMKAHDLLVLLNSFKSPDRVIHSVKIYPSEFGIQRMKDEEVNGPKELVEEVLHSDDEDETKTKQGSLYHQEKLRRYQLSRLKYFFAIVECDTAETASALYKELDGMEYESSATTLDLRFVPNDMTFEQEPSSIATSLPNMSSYKPSLFTTTALQQIKVDLTWDQTDPRRQEAMQEAFAKGKEADITNIDLSAYLASSSSEDEDIQENDIIEKLPENIPKEKKLEKYKELLQNLDKADENQKDDDDVHLEITWEPGLKKTAEELVKKKQKEFQTLTPWEEYLKKRKDRKKQKQKSKALQSKQDSEDSDFIDENSEEDSEKEINAAKYHKNRKFKDTSKLPSADEETNKKELELLELLTGNDLKNDMKETKKDKKNKKKNKKVLDKIKEVEKFKVDVKDPRFSAIYTSHHYNIEPADPHFKQTEGMKAILEEKQHYRKKNNKSSDIINKELSTESNISEESKDLITSIKKKTSSIKRRKLI